MNMLCKIRDMQRAINRFEQELEREYGLSLNEAMALCILCTSPNPITSGEISEQLLLTPSNTSKVLASIEKLHFIERLLGKQDKRQMLFKATPKGVEMMRGIKDNNIALPPIIDSYIKGN